MSRLTRRQPNEIALVDGKPNVRIERLAPDRNNHYTWIVQVTTLLRSKSLWDGITSNVDPFLLSAATELMREAQSKQEQKTNALLQAFVAGDTRVADEEMEKAKSEGPTASTLSSLKRGRQTPIRRPLFSTPRMSTPSSRGGLRSAASRFPNWQEFMESDLEDLDANFQATDLEGLKQDFMRRNAMAVDIIRNTIDKSLNMEFIATEFASVLLLQLQPVQSFDAHTVLADKGRKLRLPGPKNFEAYIVEIHSLQAQMRQIQDPTRSTQQREVDLLGYAIHGLDWSEFKDLIRLFNVQGGPPRTVKSFTHELRQFCEVTLRYSSAQETVAHFGNPKAKRDRDPKDRRAPRAPKDGKDGKDPKAHPDKSSRIEGDCFNCGIKGHRAADCRKPKKDAAANVATTVPTAAPIDPADKKNKRRKDKRVISIACMMHGDGFDADISTKEEHHKFIMNRLQMLPSSTFACISTASISTPKSGPSDQNSTVLPTPGLYSDGGAPGLSYHVSGEGEKHSDGTRLKGYVGVHAPLPKVGNIRVQVASRVPKAFTAKVGNLQEQYQERVSTKGIVMKLSGGVAGLNGVNDHNAHTSGGLRRHHLQLGKTIPRWTKTTKLDRGHFKLSDGTQEQVGVRVKNHKNEYRKSNKRSPPSVLCHDEFLPVPKLDGQPKIVFNQKLREFPTMDYNALEEDPVRVSPMNSSSLPMSTTASVEGKDGPLMEYRDAAQEMVETETQKVTFSKPLLPNTLFARFNEFRMKRKQMEQTGLEGSYPHQDRQQVPEGRFHSSTTRLAEAFINIKLLTEQFSLKKDVIKSPGRSTSCLRASSASGGDWQKTEKTQTEDQLLSERKRSHSLNTPTSVTNSVCQDGVDRTKTVVTDQVVMQKFNKDYDKYPRTSKSRQDQESSTVRQDNYNARHIVAERMEEGDSYGDEYPLDRATDTNDSNDEMARASKKRSTKFDAAAQYDTDEEVPLLESSDDEVRQVASSMTSFYDRTPCPWAMPSLLTPSMYDIRNVDLSQDLDAYDGSDEPYLASSDDEYDSSWKHNSDARSHSRPAVDRGGSGHRARVDISLDTLPEVKEEVRVDHPDHEDVQEEFLLISQHTANVIRTSSTTSEVQHRAFALQPGGKKLVMIVDSGCTAHIFSGPRECMTNYRPQRTKISTANSQSGGLWAIGVGELPVIMLGEEEEEVNATLKKVLHTPTSSVSLFSIPSFLRVLAKRATAIFFDTKCILEIDRDVSITAWIEDNLYCLDLELQHPADQEFAAMGVINPLPTVNDPFEGCTSPETKRAMLLHLERCHEPWSQTRKYLKAGKNFGIQDSAMLKLMIALRGLPQGCMSCDMGKTHVTKLQKQVTEDWSKYNPWEYFQSDTCGPFEEQAGGYQYFTIWIDVKTRGGFLFFTKTITKELLIHQCATVDNIARRFGEGICILHTDQHTSWTSKLFTEFIETRGITLRLAQVDAHGQIGIVERMFRSLQERAMCSMIHSGLPRNLFFYAIKCYFLQTQSDTADGPSKHEKLFGEPPPIKTFRPFGCAVYGVSGQRGKMNLDAYGKRYSWVGYAQKAKNASLLYDETTKKVIIRGDYASLKFKCQEFPFSSKKYHIDNEAKHIDFVEADLAEERYHSFNEDEIDQEQPLRQDQEQELLSEEDKDDLSTKEPAQVPYEHSDDGFDEGDLADIDQEYVPQEYVPQLADIDQEYVPQDEDDNMDGSPTVFKQVGNKWKRNEHGRLVAEEEQAFFAKNLSKFQEKWEKENFCFSSSTPKKKPTSVIAAMADPKWRKACLAEFDGWLANDTFSVVNRPKTGNPTIVQLFPLLSMKKLQDGVSELEKARFVSDGSDLVGVDGMPQTYSCNPSREAFRLFLHNAVCKGHDICQFDIHLAYLTARLPTGLVIYLRPFPGFDLLCKERGISFRPGQLLLAKAAIYGLPQAGRAWGKHFQEFMEGQEMRSFDSEGSLFHSSTPDRLCFTHVDDSLFSGSSTEIEIFTKTITKKFNTNVIGFLGPEGTQFLGMELFRPDIQTIFLSQQRYAFQVIERAGLSKCHPSPTPATMDKIGFEKSTPLSVEDAKNYRRTNGELIYLLMTRNDLPYAVNQVCRFGHAPTEDALKAQRRIIRYLAGTFDHRLIFSRQNDKVFRLRIFSDSDWAGAADRSSTGGYMIFIGETILAFKCKTLKTANSSFDAETKIARLAVCEGLALQNIAKKILKMEATLHIFIDNEGAVKTIKSGAVSNVNRYIGSRIRFLHHTTETEKLLPLWIKTTEQLADIYTKPMVYAQLKRLFRLMPHCFESAHYFAKL